MPVGLAVWVDDLPLKADRDSNGSYETTEHVEPFTADGSGYFAQTLAHDAAGNLTFDGVFQFTYDAWNRLVKVTKAYRDGNGDLQLGSVIQENACDGMGWRIVRRVKNSADLDCTYHDYYTANWQLVEQRNGSGQVLRQHVWGLTYIDELVQNALNDDPADQFEQDCETFHWAAQDANFNVLGIADASGGLVERYQYTAYGQRTVFFPAGTSDGPAHAPAVISSRVQVASIDQPYGANNWGYQGLQHVDPTYLVANRVRFRDTYIGRFLSRDVLDYRDSMSMYQSCGSSPSRLVDPSGLLAAHVDPIEFNNSRSACGGDYALLLANQISKKSIDLAVTLYGTTARGDAFRHCYWSCRLSLMLPSKCAKAITDQHEEANLRNSTLPKPRLLNQPPPPTIWVQIGNGTGLIWKQVSLTDYYNSLQDYWNNGIGRDIANRYIERMNLETEEPNGHRECQNACQRSLSRELITNPGFFGTPGGSDFKPLPVCTLAAPGN